MNDQTISLAPAAVQPTGPETRHEQRQATDRRSRILHACCFGTALLVLSSVIFAAQDTSSPAFEVASLKPDQGGRGREQVEVTPANLTIRNAHLQFLIQWAYDVRRDQVIISRQQDATAYDLFAKAPAPSSEAQLKKMLQALLAERLKLTFHRETRTLDTYDLTTSGTSKLTAAKGDDKTTFQMQSDKYIFHNTSMADLARMLKELGAVQFPVVDHTDLKGTFDFEIDFQTGYRPTFSESSPSYIVDLLHNELGLHLGLRKVPTEVIVVDHAENVAEM